MSPSKQPPSTSMEWTSVSIGANKLPIRTPVAPSISAETNLKARAFDYFMAQVGPMSKQFSSSEIIASAGEVFSLSTSAAHGLANDITEKVRATMFHVKYLTPVGFFQRNGDAVEVDLDPAQRKEGITYFTVSVTIEPSKIHECFREAKSPSKTIEYTMRLPQTSSSSSAIAAPGGNDGDSGGTSVDDGDDEARAFEMSGTPEPDVSSGQQDYQMVRLSRGEELRLVVGRWRWAVGGSSWWSCGVGGDPKMRKTAFETPEHYRSPHLVRISRHDWW